jgi:hypothetical protein
MVMNSFGNKNFMQPMEGPSVHSRCLAFLPFKFWEEGRWGGGGISFHFSLVPNVFLNMFNGQTSFQ